MMEILALSGSVRSGSWNTALLNAFVGLAPTQVYVSVYNQIKDIPLFNPDTPDTAFPEWLNSFISKIRKSDGIIMSTPERAHWRP